MDIPKQIGGMNIEDLKVDGKCPNCRGDRYYHHEYDTVFCLGENKWLESGCSDLICEYCNNRPNAPI